MQGTRPLEGVKVVDFSWAIVGPLATRWLSNHGATVVKVESLTSIDHLRTHVPMAGGISGINRCGGFAGFNSDKYSMALNLRHRRGQEIAKRLVAWSDVVLENFSPKALKRLGLSYEELVKVKADVIMVMASLQGQTGPHAEQPGYGGQLEGLAGLAYLTGMAGGEPFGTTRGQPDFIAPWYAIVATLAALDYRRRTGKGLCVDLSEFEAAVLHISPAILDYTVNGRVKQRTGNRCSYAAPHGAYRCQGDDRWCTIAVFSDVEWKAFCKVIGEPDWTKDSKFATLLGRKQNEDELDRLVGQWAGNHSAEEVMEVMQAAGVPAGVVQTGRDLHQDPQLKHRHHFWMLDHPEMRVTAYDGLSFRLSKTPGELRMPAPCLGEHTEYVCRELLGMSDEEFVELLADGVFE